MKKIKDYTGNVYDSATVLEFSHKNKNGVKHWTVECNCGNIFIERGPNIGKGKLNECRCYYRNKTKNSEKHGMSGTRLNKTWRGIKYRCTNPSSDDYKNYGGRGIKMHDEWLNSFEVFCEWAVNNGYTDDLTIDRINNDGNYNPSNCQWITREEQSKNRRSSRYIEYKGGSMCLSDWAKELEIEKATLTYRLNNGWTIEKAFETPTNNK